MSDELRNAIERLQWLANREQGHDPEVGNTLPQIIPSDQDAIRAVLAALERVRALSDGLEWALNIIESGQRPAIDFSGKSGYFAQYRALLAQTDAAREALVSQTLAVFGTVLQSHWLTLTCDEERHRDKAQCSCSEIEWAWRASVGDAVRVWRDHVIATCLYGEDPAVTAIKRRNADERLAQTGAARDAQP